MSSGAAVKMNLFEVNMARVRELIHGLRNSLCFSNCFQVTYDRIFRRNLPLTHYIWKNRFFFICNSRLGDHISIQECLCDRVYDPLLQKLCFDSNRITYVNIGANIGAFDLLLLERGLIIEAGLAVELNPLTFTRCLVNLQANGAFATRVVNAGIAGSNGQIFFKPSQLSIGDSIFNGSDKDAGLQVELMTLETLLAAHAGHFQRFDLLKLDCESAEYVVIRSTPLAVLGKFRYVIIEFHPEPEGESIPEAQAKLKEAGFSLLQTVPDGLRFTSLFARS
jgi:FkbM family methyltransferase